MQVCRAELLCRALGRKLPGEADALLRVAVLPVETVRRVAVRRARDLDTRAAVAPQEAFGVTKKDRAYASTCESLVNHEDADTADRVWTMEDGREEG